MEGVGKWCECVEELGTSLKSGEMHNDGLGRRKARHLKDGEQYGG